MSAAARCRCIVARSQWSRSSIGNSWLGPDGKGASNTAAGYHVCLANLEALLDTGTAPPLVDADTAELEHHYEAIVGER